MRMKHAFRRLLCLLERLQVHLQRRGAQQRQAVLAAAEKVARAAQREVLLRDGKAVGRAAERFQPLQRVRVFVDETSTQYDLRAPRPTRPRS